MDLILRVKEKWFKQIKAGVKPWEYRLDKPYWRTRLVGKNYDRVVIVWGYPKAGETDKFLYFPWRGYEIQTVVSEEWGNVEKRVFAIRLEKEELSRAEPQRAQR